MARLAADGAPARDADASSAASSASVIFGRRDLISTAVLMVSAGVRRVRWAGLAAAFAGARPLAAAVAAFVGCAGTAARAAWRVSVGAKADTSAPRVLGRPVRGRAAATSASAAAVARLRRTPATAGPPAAATAGTGVRAGAAFVVAIAAGSSDEMRPPSSTRQMLATTISPSTDSGSR